MSAANGSRSGPPYKTTQFPKKVKFPQLLIDIFAEPYNVVQGVNVSITLTNIKRVAFVYYLMGAVNGVRTVIRNNIAGMANLGVKEFHLIGGDQSFPLQSFYSLQSQFPDIKITYSKINHLDDVSEEDLWEKSGVITEQLKSATANDDAVIIENPIHGLYMASLIAFNRFAKEISDSKKVIFRVHDFAKDRASVMERLNRQFTPDQLKYYLYPESVKVALINPIYETIFKEQRPDSHPRVIGNSLMPIDDVWSDPSDVKKVLGLSPESRMICYPVRMTPTKVIDEAILIVYILNQLIKDPAKKLTLVTPKAYGDIKGPYPDAIEVSVDMLGIQEHVKLIEPAELGRTLDSAGKLVKPSIYDIIASSHAVISTSTREGFGLAYLEPFIVGSGISVFGRRLPVTKEFEKLGIDYSGLMYDQLLVKGKDFAYVAPTSERIKLMQAIISGRIQDKVVAENIEIFNRYRRFFMSSPGLIEEYRKAIEKNKGIIDVNFGMEEIARKLLSLAEEDV